MDLAAAALTVPGLVYVAASGSGLDRLAGLARMFAPALEVLVLPAWDSLPYDRTPPSAAVMGQRVHALARLAEASGAPRLLLTSARAALQRTPDPSHWARAVLHLAAGDAIDPDGLRRRLAGFGYRFDEHVDRPGDIAMRGQVIDLFPGNACHPVRIETRDGHIARLHGFDPVTQRSCMDLDTLTLRPVLEGEPEPEQAAAAADRIAHPDDAAPDDQPLAVDPSTLQACLADYTGTMPWLLHEAVVGHWRDVAEQATDAYWAVCVAARAEGRGAIAPKPDRLYMTASAMQARLTQGEFDTLHDAPVPVPSPARTLAELAAQIAAAGTDRVIVATAAGAPALAAALKRRGIKPMHVAATWQEAMDGPTPCCLEFDVPEGFTRDGLCVLAAPPQAGCQAEHQADTGLPLEEPPRLSDIVVHLEHGVCRLAGLRDMGGDMDNEMGAEERLALEFHEGTELLVPVSDLAQLWRYGTEAGHVALDRLHGPAWLRRRVEIEAQVAETAAALAATAAKRASTKAPVIKPPKTFDRVVERFAFPPSPGQQAAIDAVLADLRAGRPMDRLICGDVGFGKTEVALRAAAATALAGYQVAIVAPTTVLARQHLDGFRKRFAGTGLRVEGMMRGADAGPLCAGLADGSVQVVIGTHAIASDRVRFANLGLVVIDEEQRFGDAHKAKLTGLRNRAGGVHAMVMSATPIPRTLQAAMVGLRDVSVIATPPMRRLPTRTFVLPFDPALAREALMREHGRGGQSFVVAPRIEDLGPLAARLKEIAPELSVATAHGKLRPERLEALVAEFTAGRHDVLLATNIIEAGLDIPRANTILITGPHRFGLAQLHQMRGRVGRGAQRGLAYLLTDPGARLAAPTARRLRTMETLEGLGGGFGVAMADMDARGAGELFGEAQAGHVHAIGTELYQHILARELARLEGRPPEPPMPELHTETAGGIPAAYVPESNLRLTLYRQVARLADADAADDFRAEMVDRFGEMPASFARLIDLARLRLWCRAHGVTRLDAGPQAVALTLADPEAAQGLARTRAPARAKECRVLLPIAVPDPGERLARLIEMLAI